MPRIAKRSLPVSTSHTTESQTPSMRRTRAVTTLPWSVVVLTAFEPEWNGVGSMNWHPAAAQAFQVMVGCSVGPAT